MKFDDLDQDAQVRMAEMTMKAKGQSLAMAWLREQDEQTIRDLMDAVEAERELDKAAKK